MPATINDKFRKSYSLLTKSLGSNITDSDTTIPFNNVTNIPTDTAVDFVIDRVDTNGTRTPTKREICKGVVSGSNLINCVRGLHGTTAQSHLSGAVIEFTVSAVAQNDQVDGLLVQHNQDGTHGAITSTGATLTTPKVVTSINDSNGNEIVKTPATSSAVNEVTITNAATTTSPRISATGDDTNIDLKLVGKGTGKAYTDAISEFAFDYVVSGLVWSGDSYGSTRAASMTAGIAYISGVRLTIAAVSARTFTASKDTYIDVDNTGTLVYTEVSNNAASPALASNSIRIGIIVTGAGNIANAGSVNQGQEDKVLPIASSIPYSVTDSLGNLICPRDPNRKILGYRQITSNFTTSSNVSHVQVTGLSCPIILPTGRKIKVSVGCTGLYNATASNATHLSIWEGVVASGTQKQLTYGGPTNTSAASGGYAEVTYTPTSTSITLNAGMRSPSSTVATFEVGSTNPGYIKVELV